MNIFELEQLDNDNDMGIDELAKLMKDERNLKIRRAYLENQGFHLFNEDIQSIIRELIKIGEKILEIMKNELNKLDNM